MAASSFLMIELPLVRSLSWFQLGSLFLSSSQSRQPHLGAIDLVVRKVLGVLPAPVW